jgi:hypothetical protein
VYITTGSGAGASVPAGQWTFLQQTFTAPAGASRAAVTTTHTGTPPASAIYYAWAVRITQAKASWLHDGFGRTSASGWGQSESGLSWSSVGGGAATDYTVGSGYAAHVLGSVDVSRRTAVTALHPDFDVYCDLTTSALATGDSLYGAVCGRMADANNLYMCRVEFTTSNTILVSVRKNLAAVQTQLGSGYTVPVTHVAGQFIRVRFQVVGNTFRAKAWLATAAEPPTWAIEAFDSTFSAAAQIGTRSIRVTGNTNTASVEVRYDNFDLINPQVMTVDRARNGVVKAQLAGEDVRLARPAIVAL